MKDNDNIEAVERKSMLLYLQTATSRSICAKETSLNELFELFSSVIRRLGCKWTVFTCMAVFVANSLSRLADMWNVRVAASIISGMFKSPFYVASYVYIAKSAKRSFPKLMSSFAAVGICKMCKYTYTRSPAISVPTTKQKAAKN